MEIVELDAEAVQRQAGELAQLLLDAHAANMALGLAAPLTRERAADEWRRLAAALRPNARVLLGAVEDGEIVGAVHLARAAAENGAHRGEVQRLVVRADRRGDGIGAALLGALVERARTAGLTLLWLTTHAGTPSDTFYVRQGWTRMGVTPAWSRRPDGTLAANAFFYLEL